MHRRSLVVPHSICREIDLSQPDGSRRSKRTPWDQLLILPTNFVGGIGVVSSLTNGSTVSVQGMNEFRVTWSAAAF